MTARVRRWRAKTAIAATYASTGVVLLALALLVAFLLEPPLLGWVGFAVVCAIVFSLATVATIAFSAHARQPAAPGRRTRPSISASKPTVLLAAHRTWKWSPAVDSRAPGGSSGIGT
jgi:hypothetical protein